MKNLLKITLLIIFVVGVYFSSKIIFKTDVPMTTYKKQDNQITSYQSTPEELAKINQNKPVKRTPASSNKKTPKSEHRKWERTLSSELLKFQENNTKVIIQDLEILTLMDKGKPRFAQKIIITYLYPNNRQSGATALVDLENGKIIRVWNRTKHEDLNPKANQLTPTNL